MDPRPHRDRVAMLQRQAVLFCRQQLASGDPRVVSYISKHLRLGSLGLGPHERGPSAPRPGIHAALRSPTSYGRPPSYWRVLSAALQSVRARTDDATPGPGRGHCGYGNLWVCGVCVDVLVVGDGHA